MPADGSPLFLIAVLFCAPQVPSGTDQFQALLSWFQLVPSGSDQFHSVPLGSEWFPSGFKWFHLELSGIQLVLGRKQAS